jgi:hypothetical protein
MVLLCAAFVVSAVATGQLRGFWQSLPGVRLRQLNDEAYYRAMRQANARLSPEARDGLWMVNFSRDFTHALQDPAHAAGRDTLQQNLGELDHTQFGRLQLAAFVMLDLERAGQPPADWWPQVEPLLSGLATGGFQHYLAELIAQRAPALEELGLGPGTARSESSRLVAYAHGPLLQYLTDRLDRLTAARLDAGDESAVVCARINRTLLREWTLAEGPAGLRLLAADLLANHLEHALTAAPAPELVAELRAWRAAYREAALDRPQPIFLLSEAAGPEPVPPAYNRLLWRTSLAVWLAGATLIAGALALISAGLCRRSFLSPIPRRQVAGLVVAGLAVGGWVVWWLVDPLSATLDLRRFGVDDTGWPRLPIFAGALVAALLCLASLLPARPARRGGLLSVAVTAVTAWLVLAAVLLAVSLSASSAQHTYENESRAAQDRGEITAIAGPEADTRLAGLRAWHP